MFLTLFLSSPNFILKSPADRSNCCSNETRISKDPPFDYLTGVRESSNCQKQIFVCECIGQQQQGSLDGCLQIRTQTVLLVNVQSVLDHQNLGIA